MVRIGIAGAAGKMGARITALAREHEGLALAGAFEKAGHPAIGQDIGTVIGAGVTGVKLSAGIDAIIDHVDLIIDFTSIESTKVNLAAASRAGKAMVIGTTGFSKGMGEGSRLSKA